MDTSPSRCIVSPPASSTLITPRMCACSRAPCIAAFLHELGFRSTRSDVSLFVFRHGTETAYLLLYVDDIPDDQHYRSPSTAYYHLRAVLHQGLGASPFTSSVSRWSVERMGSFFTRESMLMSFSSAPGCLIAILRPLPSTRGPSCMPPMALRLLMRLSTAPSSVPCST